MLLDSLSEGGGCFKEKKTELLHLPHSGAAFLEGVKRAQYQFIIWKSASVIYSDKPMPAIYGWKRWDCDKYISVVTLLPPDSEAPLQLVKRGCSKYVCETSWCKGKASHLYCTDLCCLEQKRAHVKISQVSNMLVTF